jgi:hypothetical protein
MKTPRSAAMTAWLRAYYLRRLADETTSITDRCGAREALAALT